MKCTFTHFFIRILFIRIAKLRSPKFKNILNILTYLQMQEI